MRKRSNSTVQSILAAFAATFCLCFSFAYATGVLLPADTIAQGKPLTAADGGEASARQFRTWTSADGKFTVVAALVATKEGWVQLERESGARLPIQLEKLSAADIEFVTGKRPLNVIAGEVIAITDGDTLVVLDANKASHKIRLEGIDAPESRQDYGSKSRKGLADKVFRKQVRVEWDEKDRYGRTLGHIYLDDRWINKEMVADGWAWHYKQYSDDQDLAAAEKIAQERKAGLWADANSPVPPWIFRHPDKLAEYNARTAPQRAQELSSAAQGFMPAQPQQSAGGHWLNTSSNVRHNRGCRYFGNTKSGRYCGPNDGKACGICGG